MMRCILATACGLLSWSTVLEGTFLKTVKLTLEREDPRWTEHGVNESFGSREGE